MTAEPIARAGKAAARADGTPLLAVRDLKVWFPITEGLLIENAFARDAITVGAWWAIVPPGIAVAIVVVALTMLGTAIEDALNPRLRVSHVSVRRFRMRAAPPRAEDET